MPCQNFISLISTTKNLYTASKKQVQTGYLNYQLLQVITNTTNLALLALTSTVVTVKSECHGEHRSGIWSKFNHTMSVPLSESFMTKNYT